MTSMSSFPHPSNGSMPSSPNIGIVPGGSCGSSGNGSNGGGTSNGGPHNCLQHRDLTPPSPYPCHMSRGPLTPVGSVISSIPSHHHPSAHPHSTYDSLGLSYGSRHSPCSPSQGYQMNGSSYGTNSSSTGNYFFNSIIL